MRRAFGGAWINLIVAALGSISAGY
jgi:hypothetical protein